MNCKQGDLAVVFRADHPEDRNLIGCVVRLLKLDPDWHVPAWGYEGRRLRDGHGIKIYSLADHCLRPIRDSDGDDETLAWAGKPQEVTA